MTNLSCCKFAESCAYDWSVLCKQRWRLLYSFFVGGERLLLSVWTFSSVKMRTGPEGEIKKFTCGNGQFLQAFSFCCLLFEGTNEVSQGLWQSMRSFCSTNFWFSRSNLNSLSAMFFFLNVLHSCMSLIVNNKHCIQTCCEASCSLIQLYFAARQVHHRHGNRRNSEFHVKSHVKSSKCPADSKNWS